MPPLGQLAHQATLEKLKMLKKLQTFTRSQSQHYNHKVWKNYKAQISKQVFANTATKKTLRIQLCDHY